MTPLIFGIILSIVISVITLAIAIQNREAPKSRYFIMLSVLVTFYVFGRAFESLASNMESSYFGVILGYVASPYMPGALILFLLDYYNIKIKRLPLWLLLAIPLISTILVTVPELRHYYYAEYSFFPGPPIAQIMVQGSTFYYAAFFYNILLLVICLALSLWGAIKFNKTERWSSLTIFVSVLLPLLVELLYVFGLTPFKLDITMIALCFSVGFLGVAVYRLNLLRVLPLAKDMILEQMSDAFIIVDVENRYVDANATAKNLLPILSDMSVGQKIDTTEMFPDMTEGLDGNTLVSIMLDGVKQYYHLSETSIKQNGKKQCICYTLHDVTDTRTLMAELKSLATYDALTNMYNRASFYQLATHELESAREQDTPVSVFAIDIDCFKEINDTYGHFCGDEVIKDIVTKISGRLRHVDIFGRVGGDEFNVLLPEANIDNAAALARSLQDMVSTEPTIYDNKQIPVTISIGIATFEKQKHASLEQLLKDADSVLYESKNTGRNKVCVYSGEIAY